MCSVKILKSIKANLQILTKVCLVFFPLDILHLHILPGTLLRDSSQVSTQRFLAVMSQYLHSQTSTLTELDPQPFNTLFFTSHS